MIRFALTIVAAVLITVPVSAVNNEERASQMITEADASFAQNNYFMGVGQVQQACGMLRASGSKTYLAIAGQCVDKVNGSIKSAQASGDIPNATRRITALQPLIQSLIEWDSSNPRWHYEKGMLSRAQSATMNDQYPAVLGQAVDEFQKALATGGGGEIKTLAQNQLAACQRIISKRGVEINAFRKTHPQHRALPQYSSQPQQEMQTYCSKCGGSHGYGPCPNTHGG